MNKHKDHDATCLCCDKLWFSMGGPDLSEITPGCPAHISCDAKVFDFGLGSWSMEVLQTLHSSARDCAHLVAREDKS